MRVPTAPSLDLHISSARRSRRVARPPRTAPAGVEINVIDAPPIRVLGRAYDPIAREAIDRAAFARDKRSLRC
jgi:hypothetical protein